MDCISYQADDRSKVRCYWQIVHMRALLVGDRLEWHTVARLGEPIRDLSAVFPLGKIVAEDWGVPFTGETSDGDLVQPIG